MYSESWDGDDHLVLVDKETDVVLLDAAAEADGDTGQAVLFIFLHQVLDFGHVALAVGALGAEVVDQQGAVREMAKEDARIADAGQGLGKVHFHGLVGGAILHELDVGHLGLFQG